jgi:hypothetical protein
VTSVSALKSALVDNTVDVIVMPPGTYHFSTSRGASDSLWLGGAISGGPNVAARTRPVTIRGTGVTLDGGGGSGDGLAFEDGVHDMTWDGFTLANFVPVSTGAVVFGGYDPTGRAGAHHITLRNITIARSVHRSSSGSTQDHAFYFAHAQGQGPHDLLLENITIDGTDPLSIWGGIHSYHGDALNPPSSNVTIRGLHIYGTTNAVILWTTGAHDWLIDGADISGAKANAVRYEMVSGLRNTIQNVVSSSSYQGGFYSSLGLNPPGLTLSGNSFH